MKTMIKQLEEILNAMQKAKIIPEYWRAEHKAQKIIMDLPSEIRISYFAIYKQIKKLKQNEFNSRIGGYENATRR